MDVMARFTVPSVKVSPVIHGYGHGYEEKERGEDERKNGGKTAEERGGANDLRSGRDTAMGAEGAMRTISGEAGRGVSVAGRKVTKYH
jgi:hypothetical protein